MFSPPKIYLSTENKKNRQANLPDGCFTALFLSISSYKRPAKYSSPIRVPDDLFLLKKDGSFACVN
jgi:hypothetical protein